MKRVLSIFIVILIIFSGTVSFAESDVFVNLAVNGRQVHLKDRPFIRGGVTYVDAKAICSELSLSFADYDLDDGIVISNSRVSICITPLSEYATVCDMTGTVDAEFIFKKMTAPAFCSGKNLYIAIRDISSVFGYPLSYNKENATVYLGYSPQMLSSQTLEKAQALSYYFQNQEEFSLPNYGSGYCWTTSYAMLLSNLKGERITPIDVADVNIESGYSGEYCHHSRIVQTFDAHFVNALPEDCIYFAGRDGTSGGTYINNPSMQDSIVRAALCEALTLHPEGVMVRFAAYPHTMVAVAFEGDLILFNDPAPSGKGYSAEGKYQAVPFEQTCIGARGFKLSDLTFIQAMD